MHHAYIAEQAGTPEALRAALAHTHPGARVQAEEFDRFGIDEARSLVAAASLRVAEAVVWVITAATITTEAQNALLKLFEEPQPGLTFILVVPRGSVIPTLRSRLLPYSYTAATNGASAGKKFLGMSASARSAALGKLLKDEAGARERVRSLVAELEAALYAETLQDARIRQALEDTARVRAYLNDRSPSLKMLMEYLALSLPTV